MFHWKYLYFKSFSLQRFISLPNNLFCLEYSLIPLSLQQIQDILSGAFPFSIILSEIFTFSGMSSIAWIDITRWILTTFIYMEIHTHIFISKFIEFAHILAFTKNILMFTVRKKKWVGWDSVEWLKKSEINPSQLSTKLKLKLSWAI